MHAVHLQIIMGRINIFFCGRELIYCYVPVVSFRTAVCFMLWRTWRQFVCERCCSSLCSHHIVIPGFIAIHCVWYGDGASNTVEEDSSVFSVISMSYPVVRCRQQGHVDSKTLLQQNSPFLNRLCRLMQVNLYNARKTVLVVVVIAVVYVGPAAVSKWVSVEVSK